MLRAFFGGIPSQLVELLIYGTIAMVFVAGMVKCVFPLRRAGRLLRRAIRQMELMVHPEGTRPIWQDPQFLGKPMQAQWSRFLRNAQHLDTRGLSCDTEDYINDESVLFTYAHLQLAEVIPGLLTSLGILGTFIGLMRGLGNLDISTADSTMQGISQMIGGMTFAYGTSIAGVACSLIFNIVLRSSQGGTVNALDDFHKAFSELVMQAPIDDSVYHKGHLEDQTAFISRSAKEIGHSLSAGMQTAIEQAFVPVSQAMHGFIVGETQTQIEGLNHIVGHFVAQMNTALGGQFVQLAKTLSSINQAQGVSLEAMNRTMTAADSIMGSMERTQGLSQAVIERFDVYVRELNNAQAGNTQLAESMSDMLGSMHRSLQQQADIFTHLQSAQRDMQGQMEEYANWSGRVLEAVEKQSGAAMSSSRDVATQMAQSAKTLSGSYTSFVENISTGLARTMAMFEENMGDVMRELGQQIAGVGKTSKDGKVDSGIDLQSISRLQQAMTDMTAALKMNVVAIEQMAEAT